LLTSAGFSQMGSSYDVSDSSVIPAKRMPQHTEFLNGTYNFPAKPRNQWEVGIKGGYFAFSSDVASRPSFGFGAHVRKAFGYVFSARLEYMYGIAKGLNWVSSTNYNNNPAWNDYGSLGVGGVVNGPSDKVFYNYRSKVQDLALEGVFTLNNIRFHKAKTGFNVYGFIGIGATTYETKVNSHNGTAIYDFSGISGDVYKNRKDTRDALKSLMDDSYETPAENQGVRRPKLFGNTLKPAGHVGAGVAFKISKRLNLALEDRFTTVKDDLLDGQRWAEQTPGQPVLTRDFDSYNFLSLGLNINLGAKAVEPLWWLNPLDYAYSEIRNPRLMRLPKPVLPDADGDGITDQFDQEQTPQGCPVDSHGVSRDTDGDGVPDCRDKELITPTYCQPVDADGVGKCPCPDSTCFGMMRPMDCATTLGALPSVTFSGKSVTVSSDAASLLASVAARMRNNPDCRVVVIGYCSSTKQEQQLSWDRVNAVINYLVEKEGISGDRLIFNYAQEGGDCNTVDLRAAAEGEQGPNTVPAPHPNLRKNK
ncbi:MAG: OmpA family protein, partial [Bacteroidota bacterium]|nr:OmpA family protein [Bacteroidota bacterium]